METWLFWTLGALIGAAIFWSGVFIERRLGRGRQGPPGPAGPPGPMGLSPPQPPPMSDEEFRRRHREDHDRLNLGL